MFGSHSSFSRGVAIMALWSVSALFNIRVSAKAEPANADTLPSVLRWDTPYPVYGVNQDRDDILNRILNLQTQDDGDKYLQELAQAGGVNLIASVPATDLPVPKQMPNRRLRVRLAEIDRDCGLTWHRAGERTILLWPHPDEAKLGHSWCELLSQQRALGGRYTQDATPENITAALQKLGIEASAEARQRLLDDYEAEEKQLAARRLGALVLKDLAAQGKAPQAQELRLTWSELSPTLQTGLHEMLRVNLQSNLRDPNTQTTMWFYPEQRQAFLQTARLQVRPAPYSNRRTIYLDGTDAQGQPLSCIIGNYDQMKVAPDTPKNARIAPPPRPTKEISLAGNRLPLREVLNHVQKQSGLTLVADLERLRDVHLTLSVQGMSTQEFLAALTRTLLIEWRSDGTQVTAHETAHSEADRYYLSLGDLNQYRFLSRATRDDWQEEWELGRSLYDEADEALFKEGGVPFTGFSPEVQQMVLREGQEFAFNDLLRIAPDLVPAALENATLWVGFQEKPAMVSVVRGQKMSSLPKRTGVMVGAMPLQDTYFDGMAIGLLRPSKQAYLLAAVPTPEELARPVSDDVVERMVAAYQAAQNVRDERQRKLQEQFEANFRKNVAGVQAGQP